MNDENLKPIRTSEEAKKLGQKGGKKSQQVQKEKREMRQILETLLEIELKERNGNKAKSPITGDVMSVKEAVGTSLIKQALSGNVRAVALLMEIIGERVDKHEVTVNEGEGRMSWEQLKAQIRQAVSGK